MGGRKKPKATDQSLLTCRKEKTTNITQILWLSVLPVKMILAPGDAGLLLFFMILKVIKKECTPSPLKEFCLQECVVFPDA